VSPGFFKRKARAPSDTEFRGPLDLVPGDRVLYYQQELTLAGVLFLVNGKERRCQYHFLNAEENHAVLVFDGGPEPRITLEYPLPEKERPDATGDTLDLEDTAFTLKSAFDATAFRIGGIPVEKGAAASCRLYEDEDDMEVLAVEDWGGYVEVRKGSAIHENELVVKRQRDEDDWEIKPPPRIDLRSLNEARRATQIAERERAETQEAADLAAAREKLAAFEEEPELIEDEDAVSLSEIVDPQFRFAEEYAPDLGADTDLPSLEAPPAAEDPFSNVFGDEDQEDSSENTPDDPYQEYMEDEREGEFGESTGGEDASTALEPHPLLRPTDDPTSFLTEDTEDELLNAGVYEDDDDD